MTTMSAMMMVAMSRVGKAPVLLAAVMSAPRPTVRMSRPWRVMYSETMEAFHAPPEAVMRPVMR